MNFIDKIDAFCAENNMSRARFAREAGLAKGLISKWEKQGFIPRYSTQQKIAARMNITAEELMSDAPYDPSRRAAASSENPYAPLYASEVSVRYIPVYRYISSHEEAPDPENVLTLIPVLPENFDAADECFGYSVPDSSMSPHIEPGDIAIVRRDPEPANGDIVVVSTPGEETVCRKLVIKDDYVILQPFNRHFDPTVYRVEEIDFLPVIFNGKVIAVIRSVNSSAYSVPEL